MRIALIVLALSLLTACGVRNTDLQEPPVSVSENALAGPAYKIGPNDVLAIEVWQAPELSITAPVRPDGRISSPLVDDLPASGKTSTQLAREIEQRLAPYVLDPRVTVRIAALGRRNQQTVRVLGQVEKPSTIPYRAGLRLTDVLTDVGNLLPFADANSTILVRTTNGKRESFRVRLHDLVRGGDITADRPLLPGDTIIVPERFL